MAEDRLRHISKRLVFSGTKIFAPLRMIGVVCGPQSASSFLLFIRSNQTELAGAGDCLGAAVDAQLAVDVGGVLLDRADGDDQLLRNRPV